MWSIMCPLELPGDSMKSAKTASEISEAFFFLCYEAIKHLAFQKPVTVVRFWIVKANQESRIRAWAISSTSELHGSVDRSGCWGNFVKAWQYYQSKTNHYCDRLALLASLYWCGATNPCVGQLLDQAGSATAVVFCSDESGRRNSTRSKGLPRT